MTEPKRERVQARFQLTTLELRLYVVALLAVVYVFAWRAIAPAMEAPAVTTPSPRPAPPLPPVATTGPARASRATRAASVQPAPRVVRVPAKQRARRVRTRSS